MVINLHLPFYTYLKLCESTPSMIKYNHHTMPVVPIIGPQFNSSVTILLHSDNEDISQADG